MDSIARELNNHKSDLETALKSTNPSLAEIKEIERFEAIYPLLKKVALADEPGSKAMKQVTQEIFSYCLKLSGEGNHDLAKEATSVAIWCLTENIACFKQWDKIYKENVKASIALLKRLIETLEEDPSLKLEALKQVTKGIFTLCLRLAGEGNRYLAKEAASIAVWSLTNNDDCWQHWSNIFKYNPEASVVLLKNVVKKLKDHSLKLSSSPSEPGSKAIMYQVTQQIFNFSLRLAEKGNPVLPKQATAIVIWSLSEILDICKPWDSLYRKNLKASVALLEKVVDRMKKHALKLSSSPPSDSLSGAPPAMRQVTREIFAFSLKLAQEVLIRNPSLAKEATTIAIWCLTENVDCWKRWTNLYAKSLEASVYLLKNLVNKWYYHSLKLSPSPSDTLTLTQTQTLNIFRLKNQKGITEGGSKTSLYKEAEKSCEVISLAPHSHGSNTLLTAFFFPVVVLVTAQSLHLFSFLTHRLQLS